MTARHLIFLHFALFVILGMAVGYQRAHHPSPYLSLQLPLMALFTITTYAWYYLDAKEKNHQRTVPLGVAIILVAGISVPFYLYRSRPPGSKAKALLRFFGFCILGFMTAVITASVFIVFTQTASAMHRIA
jgi:hypothetical protein